MRKSLKICLSIIFSVFMLVSTLAVGFLYQNDSIIQTSNTSSQSFSKPKSNVNIESSKYLRILPSEFTEVEYVKSTKAQYIDTNVYPSNTTEIVMKIDFKNEIAVVDSSVQNSFFGTSDVNNNMCFSSNFGGGETEGRNLHNWCDVAYENGEKDSSFKITEEADRVPAVFTRRSGFVSYGTIKTTTATTSWERMSTTMLLFGNNNPNKGGKNSFTRHDMYLYYCKIYDGGVAVRDYVPCVRNEDGVAGLYDFISQEFFVSTTGTNLVPGGVAEEKTSFRSFKDYFIDQNIAYSSTKDTLSGSGSLSNPFVVRSTEAFLYLVQNNDLSGKYLELECDIILNEETFDKQGNVFGGDGIVYDWTPRYWPNVSINGNGHSIYGFYKDFTKPHTSTTVGGLIQRYVQTKEMKNIVIENVYINGNNHEYISFFGCHVTYLSNCKLLSGYIHGQGSYISGLCCYATYMNDCENYIDMLCGYQQLSGLTTSISANGEVNNCKNFGKLTIYNERTDNGRIGGISYCFDKNVKVKNCVNYGNLTANADCVGGIVAWARSATIENCINYGSLKGRNFVAGIASSELTGATFVNCKNYGEIYATQGMWCSGEIVGNVSSGNNTKEEDKNNIAKTIVRDCECYSISGYPIVGRNTRNLIIKSCYYEYVGTRTSFYFATYAPGEYSYTEISNIKIKVKSPIAIKDLRIYHSTVETSTIIIENIMLDVECDKNTSTSFLSATAKPKNVEIKSYVININTSSGIRKFYYGYDFSGYVLNYKTGKVDLKAHSGKGFFQAKVTEDWFLKNGYTKK